MRVPVFKYVIPTPLVPFFAHFPPRSPISAFPSPLALLLSPTLTMPRCVFLPDNGAFFINYVITTALLGTALDMLRPGSLFLYTIRLFFSQSEPARVHIMKVRASSPLSTALRVALGRVSGRGTLRSHECGGHGGRGASWAWKAGCQLAPRLVRSPRSSRATFGDSCSLPRTRQRSSSSGVSTRGC